MIASIFICIYADSDIDFTIQICLWISFYDEIDADDDGVGHSDIF